MNKNLAKVTRNIPYVVRQTCFYRDNQDKGLLYKSSWKDDIIWRGKDFTDLLNLKCLETMNYCY